MAQTIEVNFWKTVLLTKPLKFFAHHAMGIRPSVLLCQNKVKVLIGTADFLLPLCLNCFVLNQQVTNLWGQENRTYALLCFCCFDCGFIQSGQFLFDMDNGRL